MIPRHTAAFGPVDVLVNGRVAFANVSNGQQGIAQLRPGSTRLAINPAGSATSAWKQTLVLKPLNTYLAYAVGTPSKGTFEVLLQRIGMRVSDADSDTEDDSDN